MVSMRNNNFINSDKFPKVENILIKSSLILVMKYNEDFSLLILISLQHFKITTVSTISDALPIHWLPQH